jgi:hypothetical protein
MAMKFKGKPQNKHIVFTIIIFLLTIIIFFYEKYKFYGLFVQNKNIIYKNIEHETTQFVNIELLVSNNPYNINGNIEILFDNFKVYEGRFKNIMNINVPLKRVDYIPSLIVKDFEGAYVFVSKEIVIINKHTKKLELIFFEDKSYPDRFKIINTSPC